MQLLSRAELLKATRGIFLTILLGAIGSGVWELFLKDWINGLANGTLSLISKVWGGYLELLHAEIGLLEPDTLVVPLFAALVFALMFYPWAAVRFIKKQTASLLKRLKRLSTDEPEEDSFDLDAIRADILSIERNTARVLVPLGTLLTIALLIISWQTLYTRSAGNWASRSIEMLAPAISETERLVLRAELRRVNSSKAFYELADHLQNLAKEKKVLLPEIRIIGHQ